MNEDVQRDWDWADGYLPEVQRILKLNAMHLVTIQLANVEQDMKQATDMIVTVTGEKTIAVRVRRPYHDFRDLTLRAYRSSGAETELAKIKQRYANLYLYGWSQAKLLPEWMLVDLDKLRACGLLDRNLPVQMNEDKVTGFVYLSYRLLQHYGCIVSACIIGTAPVAPLPPPKSVSVEDERQANQLKLF
jgi:hypothetical protein